MSPTLAAHSFISVEKYLEDELHSEIRHEYIDGQVYAMAGANRVHGLIVNALAFALTPAARRQYYQLFIAALITGRPNMPNPVRFGSIAWI
jgi:Uma2 family endonuclease